MQTFKEYLEERDPELLSEIAWRKALAAGALTAASLLPSALQASEKPSSYHGHGETVVDYQKGTGVGGDNIATQKLYKKGYQGITAEETLKQDITTILKSMKGRVSEEVKIKDVYIQFIEIEKDLGKDTPLIKIYGAVKAEVLIEVHVEISGPGASQEMAYQYAEMAAKKLLDSKGFKYQRVKDVMGKKLYGTRDIVKDMGIRPKKEQINNSEVFKVELNFEVTLRDLTRHLK